MAAPSPASSSSPPSRPSRETGRKLLRALVRALGSDRNLSPAHRMRFIKDALNAALVVAGVRNSARLDAATTLPPSFEAELRKKAVEGGDGERRRFRLVGGRIEPLLVDAARSCAQDVASVERPSSRSDLDEPQLGAMGRLLQYPCAYRHLRDRRGRECFTVGLVCEVARVVGGGAETFGLASFICCDAQRRESLVRRMRRIWSAPANTALRGAEFRLDGATWRVLGFRIVHASEA